MRHSHWFNILTLGFQKSRSAIVVITTSNQFSPQFSLPIRLYIPLVLPGISVLLLRFRELRSPEIGLGRANPCDLRKITQRLLQLSLRSRPVQKSSLQPSYLTPNL